ncbi:Flagellar motor switch protein FliG, alpha-helical [Cinara cedri]|uniref:Flagellar motor switch protein FliG, alpha-helical n=1 Tax=Cinara cedri TaxID=506608 RepID=A0A5E4NDK4_9HEMI|nr:Flagellar motor switch protein FliG, alpha-helical [Cinara cedri]
MAMSSKSQSDSKEDKSYSYLHGKKMETSSENQNDCEEFVKQQSFINWQFLYDSFSSEEITELLENRDDERSELCKNIAFSGLTKLEIYRLIVCQFFINDEKLQYILKKFRSEEIIEILKDHTAVVNITYYNDEELEHVFNICSSFDIQYTIKVLSITPEKLRLICNKFSFMNVRGLLENQAVVKEIDSIAPEKLEFICNEFSFSDASTLLKNQKIVKHLSFIDNQTFKVICNSEYSNRSTSVDDKIIKLLEKKEIVENICSIGYEKLALFILNNDEKRRFFLSDVIKLLENQEIVYNIIDYKIQELKLVFYSYELSPQNIIKVLENITPEKLDFIINKFSSSDIKRLLENQKAVNNIIDYEIQELEFIFCNDKLSPQDIIKVLENITPEKLRLICNKFSSSDIKTLLENQKVVKVIGSITLWKLELICNNKKFSSSDIKTLLENQKIVYNITTDRKIGEELRLIFDNYELSPQSIIKVLENITPEKLRLIFERFSPSNTQTLLENQKIVYNISDYKTEELQLLFYSYELIPQNIIKVLENITPEKLRLICNKFSSSNIKTLLENQKIVKGIGSSTPTELELIFKKFSLQDIIKLLENIAPEKSELICEKFSLLDIIEVLEDQNAVKDINSVNTKELKAITDNVTGEVFVSIFKNFKPSVKSSLRLAIPLRRAGKVTDINIDYLNNKERICEDIIKYVPQKLSIYTKYPFPGIGIDVKDLPQERDINIESLIPLSTFKGCTECEEPVSKLYNLSLEQVIENINPHKRARYS